MAYNYFTLTNKLLRALNEVEFEDATEFNATDFGFHQFAKDAINYAIAEIYNQEDNNWDFQLTEGSQILLTDGTINYSQPVDTAVIDWDSFRIERDDALTKGDAQDLTLMPWKTYRDGHLDGDLNASTEEYSKPDFVIRKTDNTYYISPPADEAYTVKFDYFAAYTQLEADTDTTAIPQRHEQVIIDGGLMYINEFRDNIEQANRFKQKFEEGVNRMRRVLIPQAQTMVN